MKYWLANGYDLQGINTANVSILGGGERKKMSQKVQVIVPMHGEETIDYAENVDTVGDIRRKLSVNAQQRYNLKLVDPSTGRVLNDNDPAPQVVRVVANLRGA